MTNGGPVIVSVRSYLKFTFFIIILSSILFLIQSYSSVIDDEKQHFEIEEEEEEVEIDPSLTWWQNELRIKTFPWKWGRGFAGDEETDERTLSEIAFPCERGCFSSSAEYEYLTNCRISCSDPRYCGKSTLNETCYSSLSKTDKCESRIRNSCKKIRTEKIPTFQFDPPRKTFTLADVALEIRKYRRKDHIKITFLGDSISRHLFDLAVCHVPRSVHLQSGNMVQVKENSFLAQWLAKEYVYARSPRNAIDLGKQVTFIIPKTNEFSTVTYLTISWHANSRALADDPEALYHICADNDIFITTWGLHYADPHFGDFEKEMRLAINTLNDCMRKTATTVFYAGHPMQHFFELYPSRGWYLPSFPPYRQCTAPPSNVSLDDLDGWTQELRKIDSTLFLPTPWGNEKRAYCPKTSTRKIHWFPFNDLTKDLWQFHDLCSDKTDCAHLRHYPVFGLPVWDALFWSVVYDTRQSNKMCDFKGKKIQEPQFSSLARDRKTDEQRKMINKNFFVQFNKRPEYRSDLIPFIQERFRTKARDIRDWSSSNSNGAKNENMP